MTKILTTVKKIFGGTWRTRFVAVASGFLCLIAVATSSNAIQFKEARVTQIVNDVKVLPGQAAPRPAVVSEFVRYGSAVRTGTQSRSELTFADLTITRLGANTIFSFNEGTREMNLVDGAILFQVPKGSGGATIRTVAVTATITGTTGIAEFHPATTSRPQPFSKWLCLEGMFRLYLPNGQSVEVGPGKMVTSDGKSFSKASTFDIAKLVSTSLFFTGFDQPLASMNLIMLESQNQLASSLLATTTTNPLDPTRIVNVIDQAIVAEEAQTPPSPSVSPTPSKFGTPPVITSPVPYLITNGTVITTDPSITTNGVTDYGKIYRGQTDDGAFSLWAFGSTSAFDTALRIDDVFFADPSHLPIAAFKFQSLSLTGDPTIDTSNGVTKLALIGVDGITSGPPGGTLTFTGLDLLVLATVNGSINLTSDVSFQDLHELVMYARGAGSDLTINSPISNIGILGLVAEDSLHLTNPGTMSVGQLDAITGSDLMLQIGGSLLLNGRVRLDAIVLPGASVASGANLTLNVTGDYTNNSATEFSHLAITNRDHIGGDANIAVGATNISTANNLDVQIANQAGDHIGGGALINVGASNDINIVGDATFQILNSDGGHIGGNAGINVSANNTSTVGALDATINNSGGGHIGGNGNISVTTGADGDLTANSIFAIVNNRNGGSITSGANLIFNVANALSTTGDATFVISNRNDGSGGGTIGGDVNLTLRAASISVGGILVTDVSANRGGHIMGSAHNTVDRAGLLSAGTLDFEIENAGYDDGSGFARGGTIDSGAILSVTASDISTTSDYFNEVIWNAGGGHIGGNAAVNVLASSMNVATNAYFTILNSQNGTGTPAGTIGGDATINVSAANITANSLLAQIDNSNGGTIGGNAAINMNVSGTATVTNDATVAIYGSDGAVGGAAININGGSYDVTGVGQTFLTYIDGNGRITFNNASAHADVLKAGVFGTNGVLRIGGGTLSADSILKLYAPGSNGQLNFVSNVTLGGNSMMKILAANSVTIFKNVVVTISGPVPADVYVNFVDGVPNANYTGFGGNGTTTGTFAGAGANNPQPLSNAPAFDSASASANGRTSRTATKNVNTKTLSSTNVTSGKGGGSDLKITSGKTARTGININSTDQLLSMLDDAAPGPGGKITIPPSKSTSNSRNSNRIDVANRLNAGSRLNADRRAMDMRTASSSVIRRSPQ